MSATDDVVSTNGSARAPAGDVEALLVDDSDLDVERIVRAFARLGVNRRIARAHDGVEALEYLRRASADASDGESPDASGAPGPMLLDVNMPRMDGFELLDACAADPAVRLPPTLLMSTSARALDQNAGRLERHECMVKPATLPEMIRAFAGSACVGPLVTRDDIVLVDDDADVHVLARRLLRRTPRRLVGLDGARAASRRLAHRDVELLIVDARMPDGDGLELLEGLRERGELRAARTVLSSAGRLGTGDRARADALGIEVIVKSELFDRVAFAGHVAGPAVRRAA